MANPFDALMNDEVFIVDGNGDKSGPYKTDIAKGEATIFDAKLDVKEGYKLLQSLPNGKEDIFTIIEANYNPRFHTIPAHYSLTIKKDSSLLNKQGSSPSTNIHISNSQGIQIGNNNIQNITNSLSELIQRIEMTNSSPEQKKEAKGKIKELLTNPIIAAILGGATSGLLALL